MVAYPDQEGMVAALQYGQTMNGTPYVSFRGAPIKGLAELLLPALARLQRRTAETKIVVVTGVGGTDFRNKQHKHASHTKGGTVDEAIGKRLAVLVILSVYALTLLLRYRAQRAQRRLRSLRQPPDPGRRAHGAVHEAGGGRAAGGARAEALRQLARAARAERQVDLGLEMKALSRNLLGF